MALTMFQQRADLTQLHLFDLSGRRPLCPIELIIARPDLLDLGARWSAAGSNRWSVKVRCCHWDGNTRPRSSMMQTRVSGRLNWGREPPQCWLQNTVPGDLFEAGRATRERRLWRYDCNTKRWPTSYNPHDLSHPNDGVRHAGYGHSIDAMSNRNRTVCSGALRPEFSGKGRRRYTQLIRNNLIIRARQKSQRPAPVRLRGIFRGHQTATPGIAGPCLMNYPSGDFTTKIQRTREI